MGVAGRRRELGGGGDGGYFRLVIVVGRPNMPTGVGSWQDEGARQWREMTELLCSASAWADATSQHGFGH